MASWCIVFLIIISEAFYWYHLHMHRIYITSDVTQNTCRVKIFQWFRKAWTLYISRTAERIKIGYNYSEKYASNVANFKYDGHLIHCFLDYDFWGCLLIINHINVT